MWLLVLPVVLISLVAFAPGAQAGIMTGPIMNPSNGHTYYLLTQNNWSNSEAEAVSLGGHLVTINDAAENAWVVSTFANFGGVSRALWIGVNDSAVEGTFVWASGEPMEYTNWGPGEPNNHTGVEDWAHIFPSQDGRFPTWNDAPDSANAFGFVFNGIVEVAAATTWTVCASGCDYTSIKAAMAATTTHQGDTIAIAAGTYTEAGILVNKSLTLQRESSARTIVQAAPTPGTAWDRVFTIAGGVTVTLRELTVRHGFTVGGGAGIYNDAGTLTVINSIISSNVTDAPGGGGLLNYGTATLMNSTISGNSAASGGGFSNAGTLTVINSAVSGNSAYGPGGLYNTAPATFTNTTVSGNSALDCDCGGIYQPYGTLTLTNSLVADNPRGDCGHGGGTIISRGYNLDSDGSCQLTAPTDQPRTDPLLGPLQDNGGPTLTQALLPGSPAIDAIPWGANGCGTTLLSDQRWQARPQPTGGHCDIGAYEVEVAGQALAAWVTGFTALTAVCQNVTTGQAVTLSKPASPWDCEAAGLGVSAGDRVSILARGPVKQGATDVGGG